MARTKITEELVIRIQPLQEKVIVEEKAEGVTSTKAVSLQDVISCFQAGIRTEQRIISGFLPEHCLSYEADSSGNRSLVLSYPHLRADITYHNTTFENFPLPRLVFGFRVDRNGKIRACRMAVVEDKTPKPGTRLYHYPFSNVYDDTCICTGAANSIPPYKNLYALANLPQRILMLPNNDHMFTAKRNKLHLGYRELLEHLRDKDSGYYYSHVLVPRPGATLQKFIDDTIDERG